MRRWILRLMLMVMPVAAAAQDSRLQRLDTTDAGRDWEAVGRLDVNGTGHCTGALIAPDLVLTAAHCLYDRSSGRMIPTDRMEFLAGWRNGQASAYRGIRQVVAHPDYIYEGEVSSQRVRTDVALLQLQHPIRNTTVVPFQTDARPRRGDRIGVVSYAQSRSEAPSLQEVCGVMARQEGVLVMSCDVDFGSSGAPVFSFETGQPRIVSVVSGKAEMRGQQVALGSALDEALALLQARLLARGATGRTQLPPGTGQVRVGQLRHDTGAKFIRPAN